jgi:hypothetical protein
VGSSKLLVEGGVIAFGVKGIGESLRLGGLLGALDTGEGTDTTGIVLIDFLFPVGFNIVTSP